MGGDWYEGIALDDHLYALIVGDVAGHGITAVGDMAQLRAVIGALVRLGTPLGRGVRPDDGAPASGGPQPHRHGHAARAHRHRGRARSPTPPPATRRRSCAARTATASVLLRAASPSSASRSTDTEPAEVAFPAGSVLVAYTDGLIEVRGEAIDVSVERLRAAGGARRRTARARRRSPTSLLLGCLAGREPDDDVALVVIRHRTA